MVGYPHSAKLLPNGHITLFDNGIYREKKRRCDPGGCLSRALEIDPQTGEIVWQFEEKGLFSLGFGDVDRLPNGNTLITYGQQSPRAGVLEVTPRGEVVWTLELLASATPSFFGSEPRSWRYRSQRVTSLP